MSAVDVSGASYRRRFEVPASPAEAITAAAHPRRWWSTFISGDAQRPGDRFTLRVPELHLSGFVVREYLPGRRLVWHVEETGEAGEQQEWLGTEVVFEAAAIDDGRTAVTVTHRGLEPRLDCYEVCSTAWTHHLSAGLEALLAGEVPDPLTPASLEEVSRSIGAR